MNSVSFLEKAKSTFKQRLQDSELREIKLDSLGMSIWYPLTTSLSRKDVVMKSMQRGGLEHMVDIVLELSRTEDGKPLFSKSKRTGDRKVLMEQVDPDLIMSIAGEMSAALTPDIEGDTAQEEAEKN